MCVGGSQPKAAPAPAQAAPVNNEVAELDDSLDKDLSDKSQNGKRKLKIARNQNNSLNIPGGNSGGGSAAPNISGTV